MSLAPFTGVAATRRARLLTAAAAALVVLAPRAARAQGDAQPGASRVGEGAGARPARTIKPPKLVKFVEADYPPAEKEAGKEASVVLQLGISDAGKVVAVVVEQSAGPDFDQAAVAAARQFLFEPAEVNGKRIPVKITYRYDFVIQREVVQRTTSDFGGTVRDRTTKKPLAGVKVELETGQTATTDADGHFLVSDVAPGDHTVTLSGEGLTPIGTQETFEAGKKLDATYDVELKANVPGDDDSDFEIVVTAPRIGKQVVSTEIPAEQGRKLPGTQGDVLKVVENLPGVARSAVGSGQLVVWGAAPNDTQVFLEGLRIPRLYHNGGYRSVIHSDMVRSVELVPGGYGAAYGRGIGGLVSVQLKPIDQSGVHGSVGADIIDASASISAPVVDKKLYVQATIRRSHLDSVVKAFGSGDVADVVPLPRYYDSQARLVYLMNEHETLELGGLYSSDALDRTLLAPDPAETKRNSESLNFGRVWLRYEKKLPTGATVTLLPSWGRDASRVTNRFGATPTELSNDADVFAFRGTYRAQPEKWLGVSAGVDVSLTSSTLRRAGSVSTPPREGDVRVFGQAPADQVNADTWSTVMTSLAPFAEADVGMLDDKLHVVPGVRVEPYVVSVDKSTPVSGDVPPVGTAREDTVLEPRVAVRYQLTPRMTAKGAFGVYHQPPAPEDLSAVFGNPKLGLASARQSLLGTAVKMTDTLTTEVTGFYTTMSDLAARSTAATPLLAEALVQNGTGRSFGVQFLLRQEQVGRFFGWISYSIIRSLRDVPGQRERLFDYDQSHVFTAVGSYDLGKGFEVGGRVRYATGYPRTPVVGAFYSPRSDRFDPIFGPRNGTRIPPFWQIDLRVTKRFKLGRTDAEVYLDVQNVTNHQNPEEIVYSYNYAQKAYITGLPTLPVVGFKWTY